MYQVIEQTDEEKMAIYMKLSKKEIIGMLIRANNIIDEFAPSGIQDLECGFYYSDPTSTAMNCIHCGKPEHEH